MKALQKIQQELKVPKNQENKFGGYKYRSCEDIMESLKPLLAKHDAVLTVADTIRAIPNIPQMVVVDESTKPKKKQLVLADLCFVEATATLKAGDESISVTASAAIDINKAGMDYAQCFGASSSYARKYALNGMFCIDDTKDADATNDHGKAEKPTEKKPATKEAQITPSSALMDNAEVGKAITAEVNAATTMEDIDRISAAYAGNLHVMPLKWRDELNGRIDAKRAAIAAAVFA